MVYITGKDGMVNGAKTVRMWEINPKAPGGPYAGSGAAGAIDRIVGAKDWVGRYGAYGYLPVSMPGSALAFVGSIDGSVGVYGTAIVTTVRLDIEVPQNEDEPPRPIAHVVEFKANGTLTRGAAVATDAVVPNPPNPKDLKVRLATPGTSDWDDVCSVWKASLVLTSNGPSYRPGCNTGQTYRLAGNIDAKFQYSTYVSAATALPTEGQSYGLRLFVTAADYWEFLWMMCESVDPFRIPIEDRTLVYGEPSFALSAYEEIAAVATQGSLKKPNATPGGAAVVWWP